MDFMVHELYLNKAVIFKKCLSSRDLNEMSNHPNLRGVEAFPGRGTSRAKTETSQESRVVSVTGTHGRNALIKI